ncbi:MULTISPECIES: SLC13 family permease [Prochlorococcus]|uniref:Di/tricarboxylate transporter n=1 Tax=Prochlorococcus marinus (strain SARG / CCMP1375 / SS120) TaxID=167539 RepID=Q7VEB6_PROMA|nr:MULTISPECIES: SLC13 family permease [Prochlorococcus]AAP99143.1 Di/tricarboxylate transporter [Prochlorococcus marinus subsp. marinus str. CCMP1375]KGG11588.1 Di/tricarboxylate transporter [Prochlorococcus marinus str. LG]KGG18458.1 Di/tricarboxylate transporter [Prochlorococcus marinus str. SS2]KGG22731.1 Di/tricarboxylate transporter [Prochlorococcus marinus str. SS35]KGG32607.1 Di/tricarboxylate transporter [Prochlorococcus marinus str. SS51]
MNELIVVLDNPQALITLGVLFIAVLLFISGWLAPELTGLLSVALLMATGVLEPQKALAGFGSPALITLMGLFAVSAALFKSGALDRLRELIAFESIKTPRRLIGVLGFVVAPISGIVPNTPVVASLLPVIEAWCVKRNISPSRVLLPLSFATLLGGTLTLLGSSVNLLVSDISAQLGYGPLELFSFTAIGIPIWFIGTIYLLLAPQSLLPDRGREKSDFGSRPDQTGYFTEVTIPIDSELVGQSLRNSRLQRRFDVDVLELQRGKERLLPPLADRTIEPGDRLLLRVTRSDLLRLQQEHTIQLAKRNLNDSINPFERFVVEGQKTVEVLLPAGSTLAGASLRELRFRQRHNATVLALRRGQQTVQERLGQAILHEGDVLLLQAPIDSIRGLQASNDLLVLDQLENDLPTVKSKPIAIAIAIAMILLPSLTNLPLVASVLIAVIAMVVGGCIRPAEVQRSIRLDVILLLGSLSSFSVAMQTTGLADAFAGSLQYFLEGLPRYIALLVIFLSTTIFTQFISNAASVALLAPVAVQLAPSLNLPPTALLMTVLFGASQSFLTPMGYQTTLMVFGPGRYRFLDVTRYGAGLTLLMTIVVPVLILWQYSGL